MELVSWSVGCNVAEHPSSEGSKHVGYSCRLLRAELSSAQALGLSISIQRIALTKNWTGFAAL